MNEAGALQVVTTLDSSASVDMTNTRFVDNSASESGGAVFVSVVDASTATINLQGGVVFSGNSAGGSGGALFVSASSDAPNQALAPRAVVSGVAGDLLFENNKASIHGGAVGLRTEGGEDAALAPIEFTTSGAQFRGNDAGRIGGGVAGLGRPVVTVSGGDFSYNTATFGAAVGSARASGYMQGAQSATGFTIEASSASLPLASYDAASASGGCGAVRRGVMEIKGGTALADNVAAYGPVAFTCENLVVLNSLGSLSLGVQSPVGGVVFECATTLDCSGSGDPCCSSGSGGSLLAGTPWVALDSGASAVVNATANALQNAVSYGPYRATPAVRMQFVSPFPESVSTGLPFGRGGVLVVYDAFDQLVVDSNVVAELALDSGSTTNFKFSGGAQQQLLATSPVSFSASKLSLTSEAGIGTAASFVVRMVKSAVPATSLLYPQLEGSTTVAPCLPGAGVVARPGSDVLECAECVEGTFSNDTSLDPCQACPAAEFLTGTGATECLLCPKGTTLVGGLFDPDVGLNCTCLPGYWHRFAAYNEECEECPPGGFCKGGTAVPVAKRGYYPTQEADVFLECPNSGACVGGFPFQCAEGYKDRLCAACKRGYYALSGRCYRCDDRTIPIMCLIILLSFGLVFLLVWLNSKEELSYRFAAVMIGFNSLQISAMYGRLELPWSDFARQFFDIVSFLNLNFDLSSPECATVTEDVWLLKWWITMMLPLLFCIPFLSVFGGWTLYIKWGAAKLERTAELTVGSLADACRRGYFQLMALLYLPLTAMTMSYFNCHQNDEGRWVLQAAPSKSCYGVWYWNYFGVAVAGSVAYCIGIPSFVYWLLSRARRRNPEEYAIFALRYAFLVGRFDADNFRFEVWIMVRKFGVVCVMTLFASTVVRAHMATLVLTGSLMQLVRFLPYMSLFHNSLAVLCLASCTGILWAGTFGPSRARDMGVMVAIIVNICAIVVGNVIDLIIIYRTRREAEKEFLADEADDLKEAGTFTTFGDGGCAGGNEVELSVLGQTLGSAIMTTMESPILSGVDSDKFGSVSVVNPVFGREGAMMRLDSVQSMGDGSVAYSMNPAFSAGVESNSAMFGSEDGANDLVTPPPAMPLPPASGITEPMALSAELECVDDDAAMYNGPGSLSSPTHSLALPTKPALPAPLPTKPAMPAPPPPRPALPLKPALPPALPGKAGLPPPAKQPLSPISSSSSSSSSYYSS
ncbi:uncharacterized protein AMSG_11819 [Thecamonas trahens ATCC 50062]|uniref:DUF7630 domain-containing protein n=1 Tax=Thecamonas trahens ATCC 50062 TaxID=461836 RepID=A0A0L0DA85_THETB|nr:hypothetical protein AMSG_11819 [Thecamonas trahens ATCC 50062]KNC49001.1 hypothetical protein AMSG_11819 [Thecamonas trahens ATCC 50062]|eukprot:XP_013758455.1 hypothetical protein AMSG_11819 [Thecamonas trahens ATCC 50062]